jgi:16S rRNA (cytosine1402-N4)-methyltransferase
MKCKFDFALIDIGVNMAHFKLAERGFSIKLDGPLDMRFDNKNTLTAKKVLDAYNKEQLKTLLLEYGEFGPKMQEKIADHIIFWRKKHGFEMTMDFVNCLKDGGVNMNQISIVFQCIRIEVNKEMDNLKNFLHAVENEDIISQGGRVLIITFHSVEDRIAKQRCKQLDASRRKVLTKHSIGPTRNEIQKNKPSHSAKLRVVERV